MTRQPESLVEKLFRMEYVRLRVLATALVQDSDFAEDCVQRAFCVALLKENELNAHPNPQGWIMQTVKYIALDEMKKRKRYSKRIVSLDWDIADTQVQEIPDGKPDSTEILAKIRDALKPEEYALLMRTLEENAHGEEIAAEFGLTMNAYYKRMERIRRRVKKILKPDDNKHTFFLFLCQILAMTAIYK